jgi:AraC-like DNA-binding protein
VLDLVVAAGHGLGLTDLDRQLLANLRSERTDALPKVSYHGPTAGAPPHLFQQSQDATLEQLATLVDLSPNYLTTLFRHHTGLSVVAYVNDVRHREALSLLRHTDLTTAEIGRRVGYADPSAFSRAFKARAGYPPLQYRRVFRGTRAIRHE